MTKIQTFDSTTRCQLGRPKTLACSVLLAACVLFACSCKVEQQDTTTTDTSPVTESPASEPQEPSASASAQETPDEPRPEFKPLVGDWLREDGGYVLRIEAVEPDGKLKASYFNPRPINVSRAAVVKEDGSVKVGIELNDVNYPGCLYNLIFDASLDQLAGTYYQAQMQQTFEVVFVRQQP